MFASITHQQVGLIKEKNDPTTIKKKTKQAKSTSYGKLGSARIDNICMMFAPLQTTKRRFLAPPSAPSSSFPAGASDGLGRSRARFFPSVKPSATIGGSRASSRVRAHETATTKCVCTNCEGPIARASIDRFISYWSSLVFGFWRFRRFRSRDRRLRTAPQPRLSLRAGGNLARPLLAAAASSFFFSLRAQRSFFFLCLPSIKKSVATHMLHTHPHTNRAVAGGPLLSGR